MQAEDVIHPSFVVDVRDMLNSGRFESALDLSARGVRSYPSYAGGYIMLMHAFIALRQVSDADVIQGEIIRRFGFHAANNVLPEKQFDAPQAVHRFLRSGLLSLLQGQTTQE